MGCMASCSRCCKTCNCPRGTDTAEGRRRLFIEHPMVIKQSSTTVKITTEYIENPDGTLIFGKLFEPQNPKDVKAMIFHCIGFADHVDFFPHDVAYQYAELGFVVFVCDWKGHGRSDGDFILIQNFDVDIVDEGIWIFNYVINKYIKTNKIYSNAIHNKNRYFISGQSMGGAVAIKIAAKSQIKWKGMCLVAPLVGLKEEQKVPQCVVSMLKFCFLPCCPQAKLVPNNIANVENLSADESVRQQFEHNPVWYAQPFPVITGFNLLHATETLEIETCNLSVPMFICHGADDKATDPQMSKYFYENYGVKDSDKTLTIYQGRGHQLFEEEPKCMVDIGQWINQRIEID